MSSKPKGKSDPSGRSGGRKSMLLEFVNKRVGVITNDGRMLVGNMLGFDQVCNIVLDKCVERVFEPNQPMQTISSDSLNTFIVRGDDIAVIGEIDNEKDEKESWNDKKGHPIKPVVH